MNGATELELMRLLHGELPDDRALALRARLAAEPELAAAYARLEAVWNGLELPPAAPAPALFAQRTLARARREAAGLSWKTAPTWARAAAASALAAGLALGIGAGSLAGARWISPDEQPAVGATAAAPSLAESYWDSLDDLEAGTAATGQDGAPL